MQHYLSPEYRIAISSFCRDIGCACRRDSMSVRCCFCRQTYYDRLKNHSTCSGTGALWLPPSFHFLPLASKAQEQGWEARKERPIVSGAFQLDGEVKTEKKRGTMGLYCFSITRGMQRLWKDRPVRADIDLQPSRPTTPGWENEAINHGVQASL